MASFNFPFHITKNTPAVANETQTNFDDLLAWILDNLIQADGSVVMTGPLVLAPGDPASPGHAANKAYVDAIIPVGTIWEYGGTSLPSDWLWCNGDTYTDGSQPLLAGAIGRNFTAAAVPAGSFQVPDKRGRVGVGYDPSVATEPLGKQGGQRNSELFKHTHTQAPHKHTVPIHNHGAAFASGDQSNNHTHNGDTSGYWLNGPPVGVTVMFGSAGHPIVNNSGGVTTLGASMGHTHLITVPNAPAFDVDNQTPLINEQGAGTTLIDKNMQPYLVCNYIIFAGA